MPSHLSRWLILGLAWALLGGLLGACNASGKAGATDSRAAKGTASIDDEAYLLPPLSAFDSFPEPIVKDMAVKCSQAGFELAGLRRTKGTARQSIHAVFSSTGETLPEREQVLEAFRVLGGNFKEVARIVVQFAGPDGPRYYIASGARIGQLRGDAPGREPLDPEEFWRTVEFEITPEQAVEHPANVTDPNYRSS